MTSGKLKWGVYRVPSANQIGSLLKNAEAIHAAPACGMFIDLAFQIFGRDNTLDFPTKVGLLVKAPSQKELIFMTSSLFTRMVRKSEECPYSDTELKGKRRCGGAPGVLDMLLWQFSYRSWSQR